MKCSQFQQLIDAYLDNELSSNLRLEFDTHRVQCDNCQRWLTMVEAVTNTVRDDRDVPALSMDFTAAVLAATTESEIARPRRQVWRLWTAGLAAMQAAAVLAWVMLQPATPLSTFKTEAQQSEITRVALSPVDAVDVTTEMLAERTADLETAEPSPLDAPAISERVAAVATKDSAALTEIILTGLELKVQHLYTAGSNVSSQTQQLFNYLHIPVNDDSDTFCEVPTVDPFYGLLDTINILTDDESQADQTETADDRFQL